MIAIRTGSWYLEILQESSIFASLIIDSLQIQKREKIAVTQIKGEFIRDGGSRALNRSW